MQCCSFMKQKQNSICYASCIHCVTERIYCRRSWNFENSTNVGRQDIWPCHAKKSWNDNSSSKEIRHRSNCQRLKQQMEGRDRDRDIFSLWSTHGKTVHGNEHSDSVWFSDDSWVTAGDLHVKVAKKHFAQFLITSLRSLPSLFEVTSFTFWGHKPAFFNVSYYAFWPGSLIGQKYHTHFSVKISHKRSCSFN